MGSPVLLEYFKMKVAILLLVCFVGASFQTDSEGVEIETKNNKRIFGNSVVFTFGNFLGVTSTTTATAFATTTTTATSVSLILHPIQPIPIQHGLPQKARHLRRFWSRGSYCPVQEGRGRGQRDSRRRSQARGS